jgi:hypothetical protein
MDQKLGIENLKKVVKLIAALAGVGDKIGHDTSVSRWGNLFELIGAVREIAGLQWSQVLPEIKDLDAVERAEIEKVFKDQFDLVDDKLEAAIEKGIAIAEKQVAVVQEASDLVKELKA